jgi:hypothetical protein
MEIPRGWVLVPKSMTPEMRQAAKRAMKEYIDKMPEEARSRMPRTEYGGVRIPTNLKYDLRYMAAVKAAPQPPLRRPWYAPFLTRAFWRGVADGFAWPIRVIRKQQGKT